MRFSLARSAALAGKTAIVTASTDGIGLAIARRLGQDGAKVWISSRKESNVDSALTSLKDEGLDVDGLGKVRPYNCYPKCRRSNGRGPNRVEIFSRCSMDFI